MSAHTDVKREHMGTPQIILLVLIGLRLLVAAIKHGQARTDKHNVFYTMIDVMQLAKQLEQYVVGGVVPQK